MEHYLDFEDQIAKLEGKIADLRLLEEGDTLDIVDDIGRLQTKLEKLTQQVYAKLTPWQKVQVARHADRPRFQAYISSLMTSYTPLAGDRLYGEDNAIQGGLARFRGYSVVLFGHEKGTTTTERVHHNFGMAMPEGYRKAMRLLALADKFSLPVLSFIDTPGAHPGVEAESRGQAEAIASSIEACLRVRAPFVSMIIGEGGSGGAVALAASDRLLMLEHAIYSVISPEGCSSILWRDASKASLAAESLALTAQHLEALGLVDGIVPEPLGGAHRDHRGIIARAGDELEKTLQGLMAQNFEELPQKRQKKYLEWDPPRPR